MASRMPTRHLQAVSYALLLCVGIISSVLISKPVSSLQAARDERLQHESVLAAADSIRQTHAELAAEQKARTDKSLVLHAAAQVNEVTVETIREFNRHGEKHQVLIKNVSPGSVGKIMDYEAIPFQVEVSGSYRNVVAWLVDVEHALPALSVSDFELMPNEPRGTVTLKARLSIYTYTKRSK